MDKFTVLLVDDEAAFLETLVKRLNKRGLNVLEAHDAKAGLAILNREAVDIVVLDVRMPEMDGIQALREIKKINPMIEVIMLTGHASVEVAIQGMELGAFDYLMKPTDINELVYKLQDAYKKKILHEQKIEKMERELK
ncbi:MAG: response regulator [Proteobacteria bacterium]|nr:response regulator [Desulfobacteraceae bacterium]MBU4001547.1 response regulator [Pseudomonadota bacterium]MBU4053694.1 response regulator [Pseudomonadota bacterium]MBU4316472.1 response regulator [Pseudomonadota bacterium]MBU4471921.1 response regulator [Pseudomonadota bacterium]